MKHLISATLATGLSACIAHRIDLKEDHGLAGAIQAQPDIQLDIVKQNPFPVGMQCFEPMLYVITIGLWPVDCLDTYRVSAPASGAEGTYTVRQVNGWVALFLLPLPHWHYGYRPDARPEVEQTARRPQAVGRVSGA